MAPTKNDEKPQPGDLIEIFRSGYQHWAIYVGNGFVVHLAPPTEHANAGACSMISVTCDRATVKKEEIWNVVGSDKGNCEHFVTELRYGKPESRQVRKAMEIGVGVGVAAIVGFGVLALAATLFGSKDKEKQTK
ncbi:retinoic acid receptor responder 3-like isoform X2 [Triplophysa dalaica]|uniref:retinoic acid receptor responder 3-like isoform X2 n=1 Tax=Triplophysa dalaica TaxID=1582913 RepID=UPI0024E01186|nr:retinoic acid receptor responder 3-like isoform X2 [Triplophysa dalaica]